MGEQVRLVGARESLDRRAVEAEPLGEGPLDLGGREDLIARLGTLADDVEAPALVLVTHHVEEIPPGFTDVLLLRDGAVVAAGPLELTLTEANLAKTFGLPLVLERHGRRPGGDRAYRRRGQGRADGREGDHRVPDRRP